MRFCPQLCTSCRAELHHISVFLVYRVAKLHQCQICLLAIYSNTFTSSYGLGTAIDRPHGGLASERVPGGRFFVLVVIVSGVTSCPSRRVHCPICLLLRTTCIDLFFTVSMIINWFPESCRLRAW